MIYLLNKPKGCVTARQDDRRPTVMACFPPELAQRLHPVGRLDMDTQGLLLFTDDGRVDPLLLRPERHVTKVYRWRCFGRLEEEQMERLRSGVRLECSEILTRPALARLLGWGTIGGSRALLPERKRNHLLKNPGRPVTEGLLAITEGKKHQVKLMIKAVGGHVFALKRLAIGPLFLDPGLGPGEYRPLTDRELALLLPEGGEPAGPADGPEDLWGLFSPPSGAIPSIADGSASWEDDSFLFSGSAAPSGA